jgi:DNA replication protein DnaC
MKQIDIIKELSDELGMQTLYKSLQEQLQQPEYASLEFTKRVQLLLEAESMERKNRKIKRLQSLAKLQDKHASIEDLTFQGRSLDKSLILELASISFIEQSHNVILVGPTGTGKSYLAQALANKAMQKGYSAHYIRVPRLMQYLGSIRGDDQYLKYLQKLSKFKLLILDDFGVSPLKAQESRDLLEIIEDRSKLSSTIITSQLPIKEWHGYLHNPTVADAILDRIVHNSYKIEFSGESLRKTKSGLKS